MKHVAIACFLLTALAAPGLAQDYGCIYAVDKVDEFEGYEEKLLQEQTLFLSHHNGVWLSLSVELGSIDNAAFLIVTYKRRDKHGQPQVICVTPENYLRVHLTDGTILNLPFDGDSKECGESFSGSSAGDYAVVLDYAIPHEALTEMTLKPMDIIRIEHTEGHVDFELEEKLRHGLGGYDVAGHNHIHPQNFMSDHLGCVVK